MPKNHTITYLKTLLLLLCLPVLVLLAKTAQQYLSRAGGTPANLVVNPQFTLGKLPQVWTGYAQGGESAGTDQISPIIPQVRALKPAYIRIDHVFDYYNLVSRDQNGQLVFNFNELDQVIGSIRRTGALPFISLSYMPPVIAENGEVTGRPVRWEEWALVVKRTIEHISGKSGLNLPDVYYEVWNEPDLFGKWRTYGDKNYLTLYTLAATGAQQAQNTNSFKLGGPALTQPYQNWIKDLARYITQNQLRWDFISWHRYSLNLTVYAQDINDLSSWLRDYPSLQALPKLLTEWGFDPNIHPGYDTGFAAAHAAASIRQALEGYERIFVFELVDGLDPGGKTFWGRWGLLTHPTKGATPKPRYTMFTLLNQLEGDRLLVTGEGTWVSAIAVKSGDVLKILITNFDSESRHTETVPLTLNQINNGIYTIRQTRLGLTPTAYPVTITNNSFSTSIILPSNSVVLIEILPQSP